MAKIGARPLDNVKRQTYVGVTNKGVTNMLIALDRIEAVAKARGFKVKRYVTSYDANAFTQMEISEPTHNDGGYRAPTGEVYSTAQFIVHDKRSGYGYNPWFQGPWHRGFAQSCDLERLLSHPMMAGAEL